MNTQTRQLLIASVIATILAAPLTYIALYAIMELARIILPFAVGLAAYGIIMTVSIYTIYNANSLLNNASWPTMDLPVQNGLGMILLALGFIFLLGVLNGYLALGIVHWWQLVVPVVVTAPAPALIATLNSRQINENPLTCKACFKDIQYSAENAETFYIPNSANNGQKKHTHSVLCQSCYNRYPNKEKDLVNGVSGGWQKFQLGR